MSKTVDLEEINKIIIALQNYPQGIWIRALAREIKMPVSSLHYRLNKYFKDTINFDRIKIGGLTAQYVLVKFRDARKRK